jgi:hypothetical protein
VAFACAHGARGQVLARPMPVQFETVVGVLADARFPVPAHALLDAFWAYLDEFEALLARADADLARVREQSRSEPGTFLGVRDAARVSEIDERAAKEHREALARMVERVTAAAPADRAAQVRSVLACAAESSRFRWVAVPPDIGQAIGTAAREFLTPGAMAEEEPWFAPAAGGADGAGGGAAARASAWAARCANVERRTQAYQGFARAVAEGQSALAAKAEELRLVGQSWEGAMQRQRELWTALSAEGADRNALMEEVRRSQETMQALASAMQGSSTPGGKAWTAVAREQAAAFLAVESQLTARQLAHLERAWMPQVLGVWHPTHAQISRDEWSQSPRDLVRNLLRLRSLSEEQRAIVRRKGREIIEMDRAARRKAFEAYARGTAPTSEEVANTDALMAAVGELGKAIGVANLHDEENGAVRFPKGDLLDALPASDAEEFGEIPDVAAVAQRSRRSMARLRGLPEPPGDDLAATLCARLRISEDMAPVASVVVADARERWAKEVDPLAEQGVPNFEDEALQRAEDPQAAWAAEMARAEAARVAAFARADACQEALVEALGATLGPGADAGALALLAAGTTVHIPSGTQPWNGMLAGTEMPVCLPLAVLEAPVSDASRARMIAELQPSAPRWRELALALQRARLGQFKVQSDRWMVEGNPAMAAPDARKRVEDADAQLAKAEGAWAAAEREGIERLGALLPPEEAEAWRAWVRRLRWPGLYPDLEPVARRALVLLRDAPADASERAAVAAALASGRASIQRTGDAAAALTAGRRKPTGALGRWTQGIAEDLSRVEPLRAVNTMRAAITAERVRLALPPALAERATFGRSLGPLSPIASSAEGADH